MDTQISEYVSKLLTVDESRDYSCDMISSSVHQVHSPIPTDLFHQLKALSAVYKRDANCIAGDLLTIALNEAFAAIPDDVREHINKVRHDYEHEEVTHLMESAQYDAGGT